MEDYLLDWLRAADAQEADIEAWRVDVSGASYHGKDGGFAAHMDLVAEYESGARGGPPVDYWLQGA